MATDLKLLNKDDNRRVMKDMPAATFASASVHLPMRP